MKIFSIPDFSAVAAIKAGDAKYAGIAIGMGSEVGIVRANGCLLPSGRVLPLPTLNGYNIEHEGEVPGGGSTSSGGAYVPGRLELYLFESCAELAVDVRRAAKTYVLPKIAAPAVATPIGPLSSSPGRWPFSNRRHAAFKLTCDGGCLVTAVLVAGFNLDNGGHNLYQFAGSADDPAFHIGGTDHEEAFESLYLEVTTNGVGELTVEGTLIGDL